MNKESKVFMTQNNGKLYTATGVFYSALLGGLIGMGVTLKNNYKVIGQEKNSRWAFWGSIAFFIILVFGTIYFESLFTNIPSLSISLSISIFGYTLTKEQIKKISADDAVQHYSFYSNWRALAVGLGVFLILMAISIMFSLLGSFLENLD